MVKVKIKSKAVKAKKKFPVRIKAPEYLNNFLLGESNVSSLENLEGKTCLIGLMFVTKSIKHKNVRMKFRVNEVSSGEAKTEACLYEMLPYYLSRTLRAGKPLVEDRFEVMSKDERVLVFKTFIVLQNKTSQEIKSEVRKLVRDSLTAFCLKTSAEDVFKVVIDNTMQNTLQSDIKKVAQVKNLEFRKVELKKIE